MGWLRRNRDKEELDPVAWVAGGDQAGEAEPADEAGAPAQDAPATDPPASVDLRDHGPWDVSEVTSAQEYLDLGGLWLPGRDGMQLRLEVEEETERVIAATVQLGQSAVQLQAFAAPRTQGIWGEIRKEIAASVTAQGGTADEVPGPFGQELLARVPSRTPEGRTSHQLVRFAGIDGPRWLLRAVFNGEAAFGADQAAELESLVREVVVVRGTEAMAPRELLTLRLPQTAGSPDQDGEAGADGDENGGEAASDPLRPPQRGPEITEVR